MNRRLIIGISAILVGVAILAVAQEKREKKKKRKIHVYSNGEHFVHIPPIEIPRIEIPHIEIPHIEIPEIEIPEIEIPEFNFEFSGFEESMEALEVSLRHLEHIEIPEIHVEIPHIPPMPSLEIELPEIPEIHVEVPEIAHLGEWRGYSRWSGRSGGSRAFRDLTDEEELRVSALRAAVRENDDEALGTIRKLLRNDDSAPVRYEAVRQLRKFRRSDEAVELLGYAAKNDANIEVRKLAVRLLGKDGSKRAREILEDIVGQ